MFFSRYSLNQRGQSATEYAIVLAAVATALLMPMQSDRCPGNASCNVFEQLANVLRERNQGYGYAIGAVIPEPLVTPAMILPEWIDIEDPGLGLLPADDDSSSTYVPSISVPGGRVAVNNSNDPLGKIDADGRVLDEDDNVVGIAVGDDVYAVGADGEPAVDEDGVKVKIGTAYDVDENGNVGDTGLDIEDFAD